MPMQLSPRPLLRSMENRGSPTYRHGYEIFFSDSLSSSLANPTTRWWKTARPIYRDKKSPNGIVPTLKTFFANAESSTWVAWKQVTSKQQVNFEERVTMEGWSDESRHSSHSPVSRAGQRIFTTSPPRKPSGPFCTPSPSISPTKAPTGRTFNTSISCLPKPPAKKPPMMP
jgi:hypothetical protein